MKIRAVARLATCVLLCLCPALLGHCGGAASSGEPGTETGNPPRVDGQRLRLTLGATGAELTGEPGAVSAGARVRLENRSTGASAEVTAGRDGSFRVLVAGSLADTYEVTVTHQGGSVTLSVAIDLTSEDPSALSCGQLEDIVQATVRQTLDGFTAGCASDSECVSQPWQQIGCQVECGESFVLGAQREAAVAAAQRATGGVCVERSSRCDSEPPRCPPSSALGECYQGRCRELSVAGLSCDELAGRASAHISGVTRAATAGNCEVDADCTVTYLEALSCVATCGDYRVAVPASAVAGMQESRNAINETLCGAFNGSACPQPVPLPCPFDPSLPQGAVCRNSRCAYGAP